MRVLFDPTPVQRMAIDLKTEEVYMGSDFSCVAYMIEEYFAHGMTSLVIPKSRPEAALIESMPDPVRRRTEILDDGSSILAAGRILHNTRKNIGAAYDESSGALSFNNDTPNKTKVLVRDAHSIIRRLAFGFNYQLQMEMSADTSRGVLASVRRMTNETAERAVLAEIEGALSMYADFTYGGVKPGQATPTQTVQSFDQIVNDASYGGYSDAISCLGPTEHGQRALSDIRRYGNAIRESRLASFAWSIVSVVVSASTGIKLPGFSDLAKDVPQRRMPVFLDLYTARTQAIENWKINPPTIPLMSSNLHQQTAQNMFWLPPCKSLKANSISSSYSKFGTVGEIKALLDIYEKSRNKS